LLPHCGIDTFLAKNAFWYLIALILEHLEQTVWDEAILQFGAKEFVQERGRALQ
jgi:hypothetical protein